MHAFDIRHGHQRVTVDALRANTLVKILLVLLLLLSLCWCPLQFFTQYVNFLLNLVLELRPQKYLVASKLALCLDHRWEESSIEL